MTGRHESRPAPTSGRNCSGATEGQQTSICCLTLRDAAVGNCRGEQQFPASSVGPCGFERTVDDPHPALRSCLVAACGSCEPQEAEQVVLGEIEGERAVSVRLADEVSAQRG